MIITIAPILVMLIGALVYGLAKDKPAEMGRIAFFVGLFFTVAGLASHVVRLG